MPDIHPVLFLFLFFWVIRAYFVMAYFLQLVLYKPFKKHSRNEKQPVSVIICAHNEYINLKTHLNSILEQDYPDFEVLIVDDRSEDGSQQLLQSYQQTYPHLRVIRIDEVPKNINPKKNALSTGISSAQNEIILLTDADCKTISKYWIAKMAQSFDDNTEIVLGVSMYEKKSGFLNNFIQFETIQTAALYLSSALKRKPYMGVGRNLSYKKSFFLKKNGFNEHFSVTGGDDDIFVNKHANKHNTEICIEPEAITYSEPKTTWSDYFIQKTRHLSVGKYYNKKDQFILGLYHFSQAMLWIFFIFVFLSGNLNEILLSSTLMIVFWIGQYVVFHKLSTNFGAKLKISLLPVLEIIFILYYWLIGAYALFSKKVRWK